MICLKMAKKMYFVPFINCWWILRKTPKIWKTHTGPEWTRSDILIAASLTDAQMQSYISESCEVIGNIHDK